MTVSEAERAPITVEPASLRAPGWLSAHRSDILLNLARVGFGLLLLGIWQGALTFHWMSGLFVAGPIDSVKELIRMAFDGSLLYHSTETLRAAAVGFVLGMSVGLLFGFIIGLTPQLYEVVAPFVTVLNAMPRIALAPLFVLWFGIGTTSGVALVFSLVVFIALTNTISGTQAVDRNYLTIARLYGANRVQLVTDIVMPSTVPWIIAASRLSLAYSLSGAVVSEMFLGQRGLGYLIVAGSGYFNISMVFAAILLTLLFAWVLDLAATAIEKRFLRWRPVAWA